MAAECGIRSRARVGIQIGAIGTTYVRDSAIKLVMGLIMVIVLFSRFFYIPGYLSKLKVITPLATVTPITVNSRRSIAPTNPWNTSPQ